LTDNSIDPTDSAYRIDLHSLDSNFNKGLSISAWQPNELDFHHLRGLRILDRNPGHCSLSEAIYHPQSIGLYSSDGKIVTASQTFRGLNYEEQLSAQLGDFLPHIPATTEKSQIVYLGPLFNQYGHFLTETIARLWYVNETKYEGSLLFHGTDDQLDRDFIKLFFELLGITRDRLLTFRTPTRLENVVVPYPSMSNRAEIFHCHRLSTEFAAQVHLDSRRLKTSSQPLFLSRIQLKTGTSKCFGEKRLSTYLKKKKVRVVNPQTLDLQTQIELVNRHDTIIGIQGSALHNLLFSLHPKKVLYLCPNPGANFLLIDAIKNNQATYACCLRNLDEPEFAKSFPAKRFKRYHSLAWENTLQTLKDFGI